VDEERGRESEATTVVEMIALRVLPSAVRGRELGAGVLTYRRTLPAVVPGMLLSIGAGKRWQFRRTPMIGGVLEHAGFAVRALQRAGFARTEWRAGRLADPAQDDERLDQAIVDFASGRWLEARCRLLDVLESEPGCLSAHSALGRVLARLEHREIAGRHFDAAVRLGLGALAESDAALDVGLPVERALLDALRGRAELLASKGAGENAALDLRRALQLDPSDRAGCGALLAELEMARTSGEPAPSLGAAEEGALEPACMPEPR
jgi:hypothetical protein